MNKQQVKTKAAPPRERAADLLDAAEEVFARLGYAGASTAAIAAEAGATKALVHYYFGTKESLHQAVMERYESELTAPLLSDFEEHAPAAAIQSAVRHYCRFLADHPRYVRLCLYSVLEAGRRLSDTPSFQELVRVTTAALESGMQSGIFRQEDPRHVIVSIDAICRHFFEYEATMHELWPDQPDREALVEERIEHAVQVVTRMISTHDTWEEPL